MRDAENPFQGEPGPTLGLVGTLSVICFVVFVLAFMATGLAYGLGELWHAAASAAHGVRGARP